MARVMKSSTLFCAVHQQVQEPSVLLRYYQTLSVQVCNNGILGFGVAVMQAFGQVYALLATC